MRKLVFQMMTSLDGMYEGENHDLNWHVWDDEMNAFGRDFLSTSDTLLFGRKTYQLMESFWPTAAASGEDEGIAGKMNSLSKIVFSQTLTTANWNNSELVKDNAVETIKALKKEPGKNIVIYGSNDFVESLIPFNVIDEYQVIINPIVLGKGKRLFHGLDKQLDFTVVNLRSFKCGNQLMCYQLSNKT